MNDDDGSVLKDILGGMPERYSEIIGRYRNVVLAIVAKRIPGQDVELVMQDIFIRVYNSLGTFSGGSPLGHWISRIAVRGCCDYWRGHGRHGQRAEPHPDVDYGEWLDQVCAESSRERFEELAAGRETREVLHWALGCLSADDRALMETVYYDGWPLAEAAAAFGWSLAKTKVKAMRAKHKMRKIIEELLEKRK